MLVSPFESLVWDKPFVERVFGFKPLIEVYKREPQRVYGYYVLPSCSATGSPVVPT